jgi:hypothetical protein
MHAVQAVSHFSQNTQYLGERPAKLLATQAYSVNKLHEQDRAVDPEAMADYPQFIDLPEHRVVKNRPDGVFVAKEFQEA